MILLSSTALILAPALDGRWRINRGCPRPICLVVVAPAAILVAELLALSIVRIERLRVVAAPGALPKAVIAVGRARFLIVGVGVAFRDGCHNALSSCLFLSSACLTTSLYHVIVV